MPDAPTSSVNRPTYLVIIPFLADNDDRAREQAAAYADDLLLEHGEVDTFFAALKRPGREPEPLYCGYIDDTDVCTERPGHTPEHPRRQITLVRP